MNKGAIQRFAIWARNELIAQVSQRAYQYGITKEGCGEANAVTVGGRALTGDEQKQRKELVELATSLDIIDSCEFDGEINDRDQFLSRLDIFVAPSRQEAFGIHICEAMERGLPVIGAEVGGIPEIIVPEETGLLFAPAQEANLENALTRMINDHDLRIKTGLNARQRVESCFNRETAIKKHLQIYNDFGGSCNRRVHFAISSNEMGGGERVALGLLKSFQQRGWHVSATCTGAPLAEALEECRIPYSVASMKCGGLFFAVRLLSDISRYRPAVISSHLNKASLVSGLLGKFTGTATVSHVHGLNRKSYYQFSDHLVAVSQAVKTHLLEQKTRSEKISVIANCINKTATEPRTLQQKMFRMAITAKLHKNKGHKWAIEALAKHKSILEPFSLTIIGDGPERSTLESLVESLEISSNVTFTGFVNDPCQYYHEIDAMLLPSLGEGIPLSLLEAMRLGIPCIASNIGGIPEIVFHEENGLLITPLAEQELVEAIGCLRNPAHYQSFSKEAIRHFSRINDYQKMISDIESVFIKAIQKKS
jgi:glycosyltransferase involved in cell wall biosynthesis